MADNSQVEKRSHKERGLDVRAVQEKKTTKKTTKKATSTKKTASPKKVSDIKKVNDIKKTTAKKTTKKAPAKPAKSETDSPKKEVKKPASFSKSVDEIRKEIEHNKNAKNFETLKLNSEPTKRSSRIITRDVARNRQEIEKPAPKTATLKQPVAKQPTAQLRSMKQTVATKPQKLTAKELKEQEIKKAINAAKKLPQGETKRTRKIGLISRFGWVRLTLMITCTATATIALAYFINTASNEVPLSKAASYSGIKATYPKVPSNYQLLDVASSSGKITMNFKSEDGSFSLTEESTNWDSDALLNNYIKENYTTDEYSVVLEQGLTIYMGDKWETWVNSGVWYKLNIKTGSLTKKQLKTIATSL